MSGLSDYLNSLNRDGWSTRRIREEAEKHGHKLSNATASRYLSGKHGDPSQDVIEAFAAVFSVNPSRIRHAAGLPGLAEPFDLGAEGARLTGPQREAVRTVVRLYVEQNDQLARDPQRDGATTEPVDTAHIPLPDDVWGLAASSGHRAMDEMDREAAERGEESQETGEDL